MPQRITVRVPATSANLGCAFDCAALALALYVDIHVIPRSDKAISVRYSGVTSERVPIDETNLIARTIRQTLESWNKHKGFDLEIENQIPIGVGLGSSAAAIVGALAACHWLADTTLFDEQLIALATKIEGHPDNAAAAWHGGFTISVQSGARVLSYTCPVPDTLKLVLVIPDYAIPTDKARQVLPAQYSRADAVHNLQRAVALAAQLFSGKADFHRAFFDDRWHQPHRAPLIPGLDDVLSFSHPELLGICLSGAGPSVLAFVRGSAEEIGEAIRSKLAEHNIQSQPHILAADNLGAKGWSLPA
ncbi:MAG: homoserine kinase [Terriglobia bacterium]